MTATHEETGQEDRPLLDRSAVKRLSTLLTEIASMHLALGRLLDTDDEGCSIALHELHKVMDGRLEEAASLIAWADREEASS